MHASLRAICALTIAVAFLLPAAAPAAAAGPARPTFGYPPQFVTEREPGRWKDCLWASASMLVDKWTAGRVTISKDRLRKLSGDLHGGSKLNLVGRVLREIGLPAAGIADGRGIHHLERPSRSPRRPAAAPSSSATIRSCRAGSVGWDPAFWRRTGERDDHADLRRPLRPSPRSLLDHGPAGSGRLARRMDPQSRSAARSPGRRRAAACRR